MSYVGNKPAQTTVISLEADRQVVKTKYPKL